MTDLTPEQVRQAGGWWHPTENPDPMDLVCDAQLRKGYFAPEYVAQREEQRRKAEAADAEEERLRELNEPNLPHTWVRRHDRMEVVCCKCGRRLSHRSIVRKPQLLDETDCVSGLELEGE